MFGADLPSRIAEILLCGCAAHFSALVVHFDPGIANWQRLIESQHVQPD
jgi:hypothetical protein